MHSRRTATNVAGQAVIPVLVSARERILDRDKYDSARGVDADTFEAEPRAAASAAA